MTEFEFTEVLKTEEEEQVLPLVIEIMPGQAGEGLVDIYPRLGSNCEWDTAAGQCIVEEAGGEVVDLNFKPLQYNTKDSMYNPHYIVIGDPSFCWQDYVKVLRS